MEFLSVLAELKNGRVAAQLGDDFQQLADAVKRHGKKGELVLKLTVEPSRITEGVVKEVNVNYSSKLTEPRPNHGTTMFFVTDDSKLSRQDPAQIAMEFENQERAQ